MDDPIEQKKFRLTIKRQLGDFSQPVSFKITGPFHEFRDRCSLRGKDETWPGPRPDAALVTRRGLDTRLDTRIYFTRTRPNVSVDKTLIARGEI